MSWFQFESPLVESKIPISNLDLEDILGNIEKLKKMINGVVIADLGLQYHLNLKLLEKLAR